MESHKIHVPNHQPDNQMCIYLDPPFVPFFFFGVSPHNFSTFTLFWVVFGGSRVYAWYIIYLYIYTYLYLYIFIYLYIYIFIFFFSYLIINLTCTPTWSWNFRYCSPKGESTESTATGLVWKNHRENPQSLMLVNFIAFRWLRGIPHVRICSKFTQLSGSFIQVLTCSNMFQPLRDGEIGPCTWVRALHGRVGAWEFTKVGLGLGYDMIPSGKRLQFAMFQMAQSK